MVTPADYFGITQVFCLAFCGAVFLPGLQPSVEPYTQHPANTIGCAGGSELRIHHFWGSSLTW